MCHNIDVMHVEKNVCDSLLGTILNLDKKTKDHLNSHLDLKKLNIRKELHPIEVGDKFEILAACYTTSLEKNVGAGGSESLRETMRI